MRILLTNLESNPNIGLYGFCNDHFCLLSKAVPKKQVNEVEKTLKVPVHQITLCGTDLIGVFCAGNNHKIIIPHICFDNEIHELKKLKIPFEVIESKHTALGNLVLCNDNGAIVSKEMSDVIPSITKALNVKTIESSLAELDNVGSLAVIRGVYGVCTKDINNNEKHKAESLLKVRFTRGTVNYGSPYIKSGVLVNKNGMIIGESSTSIEMGILDEGLGFLEK